MIFEEVFRKNENDVIIEHLKAAKILLEIKHTVLLAKDKDSDVDLINNEILLITEKINQIFPLSNAGLKLARKGEEEYQKQLDQKFKEGFKEFPTLSFLINHISNHKEVKFAYLHNHVAVLKILNNENVAEFGSIYWHEYRKKTFFDENVIKNNGQMYIAIDYNIPRDSEYHITYILVYPNDTFIRTKLNSYRSDLPYIEKQEWYNNLFPSDSTVQPEPVIDNVVEPTTKYTTDEMIRFGMWIFNVTKRNGYKRLNIEQMFGIWKSLDCTVNPDELRNVNITE